MAKVNDSRCGDCKHYRCEGQVSVVTNNGVCVFFNGPKPGVPFWANRISRVVIDWEGKQCPAFKRKAKGK